MTIEERLVNNLINKKYTISFGESITGGMLASTIVNVGGASNILKESYITYSNEAKVKILHVNKTTIEKFTVVSEEVVKEMVEGLYKETKATICACVSGYAETVIPNEGYAWYAILINNDKKENYLLKKETHLNGTRNEVRKQLTDEILEQINQLIEE